MPTLNNNATILISRTDSIGDVVLTLPMAGVIREQYPASKILFLGRDYTRDVIGLSEHVDEFISYDALLKLPETERIAVLKQKNIDAVIHVFPVKEIAVLMKKAGIRWRIGTTNRLYHWWTCNVRPALSRKKSPLHEAQLNLQLLAAIGIHKLVPLQEIKHYYGFSRIPVLQEEYRAWLQPGKEHIILHPKSKGSAREWGLDNFSKLIQHLPADRYQVFISGTRQEGELVKPLLDKHPEVTDLTGKLSLAQFIAFINAADGLVAASTGPLHIASALGKKALGLFSPMRPIHPGRWMPLGARAAAIVLNENCEDCRKTRDCQCIREILPEDVANLLETL